MEEVTLDLIPLLQLSVTIMVVLVCLVKAQAQPPQLRPLNLPQALPIVDQVARP